MAQLTKKDRQQKLHRRVRKRITGTAERPRLAVFKSAKNIYAQIVDDTQGVTLAFASSLSKEFKADGSSKHGANLQAAELVGKLLAERAKQAEITAVVFDRGGFQYHGRIKALADAAREGGLEF